MFKKYLNLHLRVQHMILYLMLYLILYLIHIPDVIPDITPDITPDIYLMSSLTHISYSYSYSYSCTVVINPFTIYVSRAPPPNGRHPGRRPSTINPLSNASTPQPPVTLIVRRSRTSFPPRASCRTLYIRSCRSPMPRSWPSFTTTFHPT